MNGEATSEWADAVLNRPITRGDRLREEQSRLTPAELEIQKALKTEAEIIVGVEDSARSRDAVAFARILAETAGARIVLANAYLRIGLFRGWGNPIGLPNEQQS